MESDEGWSDQVDGVHIWWKAVVEGQVQLSPSPSLSLFPISGSRSMGGGPLE